MAIRSGDVRRVCHRLLQRLALARRAIIEISFPTIPWPMTEYEFHGVRMCETAKLLGKLIFYKTIVDVSHLYH